MKVDPNHPEFIRKQSVDEKHRQDHKRKKKYLTRKEKKTLILQKRLNGERLVRLKRNRESIEHEHSMGHHRMFEALHKARLV